MADKTKIRYGFESKANSEITGSLIVSASGTDNPLVVDTNKLFVSSSAYIDDIYWIYKY